MAAAGQAFGLARSATGITEINIEVYYEQLVTNYIGGSMSDG